MFYTKRYQFLRSKFFIRNLKMHRFIFKRWCGRGALMFFKITHKQSLESGIHESSIIRCQSGARMWFLNFDLIFLVFIFYLSLYCKMPNQRDEPKISKHSSKCVVLFLHCGDSYHIFTSSMRWSSKSIHPVLLT